MKKISFYLGTSILLFLFSIVLAWAVPAKSADLPASDGALLVADDSSHTIWRVKYNR